jgi:hypothetical protein
LLYVKKPSMPSAREFKEKRVEAVAKLAALDLEESNRETEYEERAKMERGVSVARREAPISFSLLFLSLSLSVSIM